jgi:hypothetical protein
MAFRVYILSKKSEESATFNLVSKLNGNGEIEVAKQAYVFGGPLSLRTGDADALIATTSADVKALLKGLEQSGHLTMEEMATQAVHEMRPKAPWPVQAEKRVVLPAQILPKPFKADTFKQKISTAPRLTASDYQFLSVRSKVGGAAVPIDLTGHAAFLWYGHVTLENGPLVLVADASIDPTQLGAPSGSFNFEEVKLAPGAEVGLPVPEFDLRISPFAKG